MDGDEVDGLVVGWGEMNTFVKGGVSSAFACVVGRRYGDRKERDLAGDSAPVGDWLLCVGFELIGTPPDLVGLPQIQDGRTVYAAPAILPQGGAGVLMLEELNRAERYMQQPALQLLTARKLHSYALPEGWSTSAAINPRRRGLSRHTARSCAACAISASPCLCRSHALACVGGRYKELANAILGMARTHDLFFETVPPRTWAHASRLLTGLSCSGIVRIDLFWRSFWVAIFRLLGRCPASAAWDAADRQRRRSL